MDWDYDPPRTASELAYHLALGGDLSSYVDRRIKNPRNNQLTLLLTAVSYPKSPCAKAQLLGEFFHAFEDTFAHRNQNNAPISISGGIGHLAYGHSPDKTYNHTVAIAESPIFVAEIGQWNNNESRAFEMEFEVFGKLRQIHATSGKNQLTGASIAFNDIAHFLKGWNRNTSTASKFDDLAFKLEEYGLGPLPKYNLGCASAKRKAYLGSLSKSQYIGVILPTSQGSAAEVENECR